MKVFRACREVKGFTGFRRVFWVKWLSLVFVMTLCVAAGKSNAAQISFEPNGITINAAPGEVVSVPFSVSLTETSLPNSYASFNLAPVGGTLEPAWINSQGYISLNSWYKTRQAVLQIRPPADAKGGVYSTTLQTVRLRSNESIAPAEFVINVEIKQLGCSQTPVFSEIASSDNTFEGRNNKEVSVDLSGSVSVPEGCEIDRAWYQLTDEYGEMDKEEAISISADGSFSASVPMRISRKGSDKDGRLYVVKFLAENESGVGESLGVDFVVTHDNRKK